MGHQIYFKKFSRFGLQFQQIRIDVWHTHVSTWYNPNAEKMNKCFDNSVYVYFHCRRLCLDKKVKKEERVIIITMQNNINNMYRIWQDYIILYFWYFSFYEIRTFIQNINDIINLKESEFEP